MHKIAAILSRNLICSNPTNHLLLAVRGQHCVWLQHCLMTHAVSTEAS